MFTRIEYQVIIWDAVFTKVKPWFRKPRFFVNEEEVPKKEFVCTFNAKAREAVRGFFTTGDILWNTDNN